MPAGVDDAAYVKAAFLADLAKKKIECKLISPKEANVFFRDNAGWLQC